MYFFPGYHRQLKKIILYMSIVLKGKNATSNKSKEAL
jgi:hypothetical protein